MKAKFKTLTLQNLRIGELFAFLTLILPIINACTTISAKLKKMLEEMAKTMVALEAATNSGSFEEQTKVVKSSNAKRETSISRFQHFVEYFKKSDDEKEITAANLILKALKDAGSIYRMGLKDTTTAIHGLNVLFTTNSRYVEALTLLKATAEWGKVWANQQEFESAYGYRNNVMADEKLEASAYEISKMAKSQCSAIMELIEDLYNVEEKPEYLAIIDKVNLEIEKTMAVVRTRETLAAKERKDPKKSS
ncbi:DUF6261 family protein [uncultured Acetobacteroides sp.]|uniref:DUF6261 family protein n=1 Tax=uncultured Acetobacteroides sp. TaxID=1760811 RepID=UPI0029F56F81|nr:DUF6261 family protein [uncultured Acetobacteroides sp.]